MKGSMKAIVVGVVPAICGAAGMSAFGEKISWPESPSPQQSFDAASRATASSRPSEPTLNIQGPVINLGGPLMPGDLIIINGARF